MVFYPYMSKSLWNLVKLIAIAKISSSYYFIGLEKYIQNPLLVTFFYCYCNIIKKIPGSCCASEGGDKLIRKLEVERMQKLQVQWHSFPLFQLLTFFSRLTITHFRWIRVVWVGGGVLNSRILNLLSILTAILFRLF